MLFCYDFTTRDGMDAQVTPYTCGPVVTYWDDACGVSVDTWHEDGELRTVSWPI